MRTTLLGHFLVLITALVVFPLLGASPTQAMRGGEDATGDQLVVPMSYCSGALVHPRIAVTAAHCRWLRTELVYTPGSVRGADMSPSEGIATFVPALPWNSTHPRHDIALWVLAKPLPFNSNVRVATTQEIEEWMSNQSPGWIYGYGSTYEGDIHNKRPHRSAWYPLALYREDKYIVTESRISTTATCSGDSGGPTYIQKGGDFLYVGPTASTNIPQCADINWPFGPRNSSPILAFYPELMEQALAKVAELEAAEARVKEEEAQKAKIAKEQAQKAKNEAAKKKKKVKRPSVN